jgi:hypothetical protein
MKYLQRQSKVYEGNGYTEYVNYYEMNKQISYFLYYDVQRNKILNLDKKSLKEFVLELLDSGFPIMPKEHIDLVIDELTLS